MVDMSSSSPSPPRVPPPDGADAGITGGFVARLGGVSLMDLIQFECQRGGQRILRVTSRGQSGYLYFRAGELVHAATAVFTGTAAVREMLAWHSGSIESGMGEAPPHESIPSDWRTRLPGAQRPKSGTAGGAPDAQATEPQRPKPPEKSGPDDIEATVVLGPSGQLLAGNDLSGLSEAASYAAQMAELIGGFLGFDRFCALEASYGQDQLLVGRVASTGHLLARRGKSPAALEELRREVAPDKTSSEAGGLAAGSSGTSGTSSPSAAKDKA
jgi:hypothetical protein